MLSPDFYSKELADALARCQTVTNKLQKVAAEKGVEWYLADSVLYLELFGIVTIAWQWLKQGIAIYKKLETKVSGSDEKFLKGKLTVLKFFYRYELPKLAGLEKRLMNNDGLTVTASKDDFFD